MTSEGDLLRRYARHGDEAAFAEIVRRHVDMVYSVARRLAGGDTQQAQDVAQRVFTDLARKAHLLCHRPTLGGWLHTSTRYAARDAAVSQHRRRAREQEAAIMQQILSTPEIPWEQLRPVLDDAVSQLSDRDREAVVLRFFQQKSHREIGDALGLTENAARMRVERALEKLREYFSRQGINAPAVLLASAVSTHAVEAAPAGFAAHVTAASLAGGATKGIMSTLRKYILTMNKTSQIALAAAVVVLAILPFLHLSAAAGSNAQPLPVTLAQNSSATAPAPSALASPSPIAEQAIPNPASAARTIAPAPPPAPPPADHPGNPAAATGPATATPQSPRVTAPASPASATNAPITSSSLPPKATDLPSHNVQVHVYGEIYPGYPIDFTVIGVGDIRRTITIPRIGGVLDDGDSAEANIVLAISAAGDGYRIGYLGMLTVLFVQDNYQRRSIGAQGEATLRPGQTATASSSEGGGSLSVTVTELPN